MTKATKYTVAGAIGTRKSPRAYTHAICARIDHDAALRSSLRFNVPHNVGNLSYFLELAARTTTENRYPNDAVLGNKGYTYSQGEIDSAKAWVVKYGSTPEAVKAATIAECHAKHSAALAKPTANALYVLQWSQSAANANKALGTWAKRDYRDLQVLPTIAK